MARKLKSRLRLPVTFPLSKHVQEGQMITLIDTELLPRSIRFLLPLLRPVKHTRNTQHTRYRQNFGRAFVSDGGDEHLRHRGLHGEFRHLATDRREISSVGKSAEDPELVHGIEDVVLIARKVSLDAIRKGSPQILT